MTEKVSAKPMKCSKTAEIFRTNEALNLMTANPQVTNVGEMVQRAKELAYRAVGTMHDAPCPYDAGPVVLVTGRDVYPHRPDLFNKPIWRCVDCGAYTGCHPGTTKRVGRLANAETRALKVAAHAAFDPLWQSGRMTRKGAYAWLGERLGMNARDCHIGWMDDKELRRVPEVCTHPDQQGGEAL